MIECIIDSVMHSFYSVLIHGAARLYCEIRVVGVPPSFQPEITTSGAKPAGNWKIWLLRLNDCTITLLSSTSVSAHSADHCVLSDVLTSTEQRLCVTSAPAHLSDPPHPYPVAVHADYWLLQILAARAVKLKPLQLQSLRCFEIHPTEMHRNAVE